MKILGLIQRTTVRVIFSHEGEHLFLSVSLSLTTHETLRQRFPTTHHLNRKKNLTGENVRHRSIHVPNKS